MSVCPLKIIDYNYAVEAGTTITASSEDTSFPASNLSSFFRSKVWRSSGTFVISSTNNKIDFKESGGGGELTATITSGTYTATTLATEIKAQMESAGAEMYTVSQSSSTGAFTISTGGAYLDLLFNTGTNAVNAIASSIGFAASDYTGALTYTGTTAIHTEESIVFDLGTTEQIDHFAMFFDPRRGIRFSDAAVLKLQANGSDSWASPSVDVTLTVDNVYMCVSHVFAAAQSYRYWRVKIVDPANADLYVEVGTIVLGLARTTTRVPSKGFEYTKEDMSQLITNKYGNVYADVYQKKRSIKVDLKVFSQADLVILEDIYNRVASYTPVLISIDYDETVFDKHQFFLYCRFKGAFNTKHVFYEYMDSSFDFEEFF